MCFSCCLEVDIQEVRGQAVDKGAIWLVSDLGMVDGRPGVVRSSRRSDDLVHDTHGKVGMEHMSIHLVIRCVDNKTNLRKS